MGNKGAEEERGEREIEKEREGRLMEERVLGAGEERDGRRKRDERQRELKNERKEKQKGSSYFTKKSTERKS